MENKSAVRERKIVGEAAQGGDSDHALSEHLWKTIQRFDFYIGSTNAKAAFLIAFNSALFGGVLLKWQEIMSPLGHDSWPALFGGGSLAVLAMGCMVSTWITFRVVTPFLSSPKHPGIYHSTIFFCHVAEHDSPEKFITVLDNSDSKSRTRDLAQQAHALAVGLNGKFINLRRAIACIVLVQLPALLLLLGAIVVAITRSHIPHP